jgi:hypothetical protein
MPFADYKDFAECVRKNSDKGDPEAYCASIKNKVEESNVHEVIDASEAEFSKDEATGKMTGRVKIIQAGRAKNPRNYRSSALRKAAKEGVYNGLRMFVNHSDKPPTKRSYDEMVAAVESSEYDPKTDAIYGKIVYFDEKFFEKAQAAKDYMGVSASHRIRVNYVQEGQKTIEDVQEIISAHSVDWVIYPSAGGEVISFARESEGADEVEWNEVTLDDLKTNAPKLLEEFRSSIIVKESTEPDPPDDGGEKLTRAEVAKLVQEQVAEVQKQMADDAEKKEETAKKYRDFISKSGLPNRTQSRLISQFAGATTFAEEDVKEAVEEAKAELKEAGAGPKITGMGPSGSSSEGTKTVSVKESVETFFGITKKADPATTASATPKES